MISDKWADKIYGPSRTRKALLACLNAKTHEEVWNNMGISSKTYYQDMWHNRELYQCIKMVLDLNHDRDLVREFERWVTKTKRRLR